MFGKKKPQPRTDRSAPPPPELIERFQAWADEEDGLVGRCWTKLCGAYHNLPFVLFGWRFSILRVLFSAIWLGCWLTISLSPVWLRFIYDLPVTLEQAILVSVILAVAGLYMKLHDSIARNLREDGERRLHAGKLASKSAKVMGASALAPAAVPERDIIRDVLACMRKQAQIVLKDYSGNYLEVSLLIFDDADCNRMRIVARAEEDRGFGTEFAAPWSMAYFVAKAGSWMNINDFRCRHPFPKDGITGADPPYRSVLLIALLENTGPNENTCVGVVTLDSSRPYHFWRNYEFLYYVLQPYATWLTVLLSAHPHRIQCEA